MERWAHWGGRSASEAGCDGPYTDLPCVRSGEVIGYESRLSEVFGAHSDASSVSVTVSSLDLVKLMAPFKARWLTESHEYWAQELNMECHHGRAPIMLAFVRWHGVEVFPLLCTMRYKHYVGVPD